MIKESILCNFKNNFFINLKKKKYIAKKNKYL